MTHSVTVFKPGKGSAIRQDNVRHYEVFNIKERFPIAQPDEQEPSDPTKRTKLAKQKRHYDIDAPFYSKVRPQDAEIAFLPESAFNFPALPVAKSDVIIVGQVLSAEAHRSNNKRNVFSNFEVRIEQVLKGNNLIASSIITVQRIGGYVVFPNGQKVLFRLSNHGMPAVSSRYAFFLNSVDEDYSILTAYELRAEGVVPLDYSRQFQTHEGLSEADFIQTLHTAISQALP